VITNHENLLFDEEHEQFILELSVLLGSHLVTSYPVFGPFWVYISAVHTIGAIAPELI